MSDAVGAEILTPFGTYRTPQENVEIIELLEDLLEKAKKGEIAALAVASLMPNDHSLTNWRCGTHSMFTLIGLVDVLKDDILQLARPCAS